MMRILEEWTAGLDRHNVTYALTGDFALSIAGYDRPRPILEFAIDPAAHARALACAEDCGYESEYASSRCSVFRRRGSPAIVLLHAATRALPVPFGERTIHVAMQPAERFALSDDDATALGAISECLTDDVWLEWMKTIAALRPSRLNTDADEPFTL
jgi:hypothetical protein